MVGHIVVIDGWGWPRREGENEDDQDQKGWTERHAPNPL
jgi:hypothetical protein